MSDKYQGFVSTPIGKLLVKNLGLPSPTKLDRYDAGDPLVDGTVLVGGTGRLAESLPGLLDVLGIASTRASATGDDQRLKGVVFDATGLKDSAAADRAAGLLHPDPAQPRQLRAGRGHRHPARADQRLRARRPARARGLHPQPRQGDRQGQHRPAGLRRRGLRGRRVQHPRLPPLPQVRLRLGPGRPDRRQRQGQGHRGGRPDPAAGRQGRARHRRQPRHRRGDRPGPAPRRREGRRPRRTPGRERAADPDEGARRRLADARHQRRRRPAADRAPPQGEARRRRRRRPQRRHHPRPQARQHGRQRQGRPLGAGPRRQPHRAGADHP